MVVGGIGIANGGFWLKTKGFGAVGGQFVKNVR